MTTVGKDVNRLQQLPEEFGQSATHSPDDFSMYTPIQKILIVDFRSNRTQEVLAAMVKLAELCHDGASDNDECSQNRTTIHKVGGAPLISAAMSHWRVYPNIQAEGCVVLTLISYENTAFRKAAKDAGVFEAVTWAMKAYPDNLAVQTNACVAIQNLVADVRDNAEFLVNTVNTLDGINLIVAAMKKFPNHAGLQLFACGVLYNLSQWDEGKDAVKRAGGRAALEDAMKNHSDKSNKTVKGIHEWAAFALKNLL